MNIASLILWIISHLPEGAARDDLQAYYDKHYGGTVHTDDGGTGQGGGPK